MKRILQALFEAIVVGTVVTAILVSLSYFSSKIPYPIASNREKWPFAYNFAKEYGFVQNFSDEYDPSGAPKGSRLSHNTFCGPDQFEVSILGNMDFKCVKSSSLSFNEVPGKVEGTIQVVITKKSIEAFTISQIPVAYTQITYDPDKISEKYGLKTIIDREQSHARELKFWCNYYLKICFK